MLSPVAQASSPVPGYASPFRLWDSRSAVRAKPLHTPTPDDLSHALPFSPELAPVSVHPLVTRRGPQTQRRLLAYHLYAYLDFTETLENEIINPVCYLLSRRYYPFDISREMAADARKISVDEAHHALFCADMIDEVEAATGFQRLPRQRPPYLDRLDRLKDGVPAALVPLVTLFFTSVSETLITGTLTQAPRDERVIAAVRSIIKDHAEDEARHHVYFAKLVDLFWPQLAPEARAVIGPLLPEFFKIFLTPDLAAVGRWLGAIGLSRGEIAIAIADSYPQDMIAATMRKGAEGSLLYFQRSGVLDDPATADAFAASGLMPGSC